MENVIPLMILSLVPVTWYQAQKHKKEAMRWVWLFISLAALWFGFYLLKQEQGTEFAVFMLLFHISWLAWVWITFKGKVKAKKTITKPVTKGPKGKPFSYKLLVFILSATLGLLSSILVAQALAQLTINQTVDQWAMTLMSAPLIWGAWVTWLASDRLIYRPIIVLTLLTLASWWYLT